MIRQEGPGKAFRAALRQQGGEAGNEALLVGVIGKDIAAFDSANDDVMQNMRDVESGLAWHGRTLAFLRGQGNG